MPATDVTLRVWRGNAESGDFVDYTVPVEEGEVVLDAIHRLQATQANDLAVRWNCKAGKCGSCSAEINGYPRLMCMTRFESLDTSQPVTVNPVRTFPVVRDLVTDVSFNFEMARRVPAFAPPHSNEGGRFRMAQTDVERGQEFRKCIECFLCQNVCHVIRDHEENKPKFAGPRFFIRYAELEMHPLDTNDRRRLLQERMGLGYCNITKCCTEVCPENIKITDNAIIPMKERVVDMKYDPALLFRRVRKTEVGPAGGVGPSPIKRPGGGTESGAGGAPTGDLAVAPPAVNMRQASRQVRGEAEHAAPAPGQQRGGQALRRWGPAAGTLAAGVGALVAALRARRGR